MEYNMMPPPSSALSDMSSGFGDGNLSSGSSCGSTDHKHGSSGYTSQKSLESITEEDTKPPSEFLHHHKPVVLAGRAHVNRPPPLNLLHTGSFLNESNIQTTSSYQYQTENSPQVLQSQHLGLLSGHNAVPQSPHHRILQGTQIAQNICHSPSQHAYQEHIGSPHPQSATPHATARYTFNERQNLVSNSLPGTPYGDTRINSPLHRVQNMHHYNSTPHSPHYNANQFDPSPSHHFIENKQQALQSGYNDPHPSPLPYNQKNSPHSYTDPTASPAAHYTETKPSPHHFNSETQQVHGMHQSSYSDVVNKMGYRNPAYDPGTPFTNPSHPGTPAYADSPHHSSPHPQTYQHFFGPDYAHRMHLGPDIKPNISQDGQYPQSSSSNLTDNDGLLHDRTAAANTLLSAINMKQEHDPLSITQESHSGMISNQVMDTDWNQTRIKPSTNQQALSGYNMFDGSTHTDVDELLTQATEFMNSTSMSLSSDGSGRSDTGKAARSRSKGRPSKNSMSPRSFGAQCPVCAKSFNNSSALAKHKLTHSDERKYVCAICSKAFKRQDHLNGHMMTHRSKKPFECSFDGCTKSYCDARSLRRHLENHHNVPSDSLYDMSLNNFGANGSTFNSPTGGNNYQQSENQSPSRVSPGSTYPPGSGQLFRYDSQTSNQSREGSKPAECTVCGKKFKNLPALNGHMRLHGGYVNQRKPDQPAAPSDRSQSLKSPADSLSSISSASQLVTQSPALPRKALLPEMDQDSLNPHTLNENQGNVRQGGDGAGMGHTLGPAVLPYGGFPSPGAAAAALLAQSSSAPLTSQNNDFYNQRERMVQEIMQMQHRMPYIPIGGTQLYPSLIDNIGDRPDPLQNLTQLASLPNQLRMPVSYMNDPAAMARSMVSQPSMTHHQPRPAMVASQPPVSDPLPLRPSRPEPAPPAVQQPLPPDSTTQQADMEVSEINHPNKEQDSDTAEFQAKRKRHASAPDALSMVTDQQQASLKDKHHSYAAVDTSRRRRLSADAYNDHEHLTSRHRHRTADQPLAHSDGATLFRSPQPVQHSQPKKRKTRPEPLVIHPNLAATQSRLRSPRIWEGSLTSSYPSDRIGRTGKTPPPYTPPPILSPLRTGTGLYYGSHRPSHTPLSASLPAAHFNSLRSQPTIPETCEEPQIEEKPPLVSPPAEEIPPPIETDIQPHINIGPNHQAVLPQLRKSLNEAFQTDEHAQLLWTPNVLDSRFTSDELDAYMEFACSAAVPGSGSNKEYALHQLFFNKGDLMKSVLCMMERSVKPQFAKFIKDYHYQDSDVWTTEDIENYTDSIMKSDKDFHSIALTFQGRKSHKQCIEFYYLWKKICPEEYKRLRLMRRKKRMEDYNLRPRDRNGNEPADDDIHPVDDGSDLESNVSNESEEDTLSLQSSAPSRTSVQSAPVRPHPISSPAWLCEYPGCNAVFTTKQALTGHARIHGPIRPVSNPNRSRDPSPSPMRKPKVKAEPMPIGSEEFPCKLCGKVFYKVKSRSAHMKSHSVLAKKSKEQKAAQQQHH